MAHITKSKTEV